MIGYWTDIEVSQEQRDSKCHHKIGRWVTYVWLDPYIHKSVRQRQNFADLK